MGKLQFGKNLLQHECPTSRLAINLVILLSFIGFLNSPKMSLKFSDNFELALQILVQKAFLMRITGDIDAKSKKWYVQDNFPI